MRIYAYIHTHQHTFYGDNKWWISMCVTIALLTLFQPQGEEEEVQVAVVEGVEEMCSSADIKNMTTSCPKDGGIIYCRLPKDARANISFIQNNTF